jgi:hypothetical protein
MAIQDVIPVEFGDVFPQGVFAAGEVRPVKDWDRSTDKELVQLEVEALDPETAELVRLPVWLVTVTDGESAETAVVQVLARHQPVLPEPLPGTPFRPVELVGLAMEPYINRDKCKAPWGGRQHRCGARITYKYWARELRPVVIPAATGGRNGKADS